MVLKNPDGARTRQEKGKTLMRNLVIIAMLAASAIAFTGCKKEETLGDKLGKAVDKTEEGAKDAAKQAEKEAAKLQEKLDEALKK
jgi:hypothetical protein